MKSYFKKLCLNLTLWLEMKVGLYKDVSSTLRYSSAKSMKELKEELDTLIQIANSGIDLKKQYLDKMIKIRLSAGILSVVKLLRPDYKITPTRDIIKLKSIIEDALNIKLVETECGIYEYNNKSHCLTWHLVCDQSIKRQFELYSILVDIAS